MQKMEKSFGCFFYLKKKGKSLSVELPVYLRITVDSESAQVSTKRSVLKLIGMLVPAEPKQDRLCKEHQRLS